MSGGISFFEVKAIPDKEMDTAAFFDAMGAVPMLLRYDMQSATTLIGVPSVHASKTGILPKAISGLALSPRPQDDTGKRFTIFTFYRKLDTLDRSLFSDIFDMGITEGSLSIAFIPVAGHEADEAKAYIEGLLSRRKAGETVSMLSDVFSKRQNTSIRKENFANSEEAMMLTEMLESLNSSLLRNGICYKLFFITDNDAIEGYLGNRFLLLSRQKSDTKSFDSVVESLGKARALPIGISMAKNVLSFRGFFSLNYMIPTIFPRQSGEITVGTYMKSAVSDTGLPVKITPSTLNLGFILTGLPGSGKTNAAMSLIEALRKAGNTQTVIISPTNEWDGFAESNGMGLIKLYDEETPINFFSCPGVSDKIKFYEDLAMILSSASNAGPYRNPMEKCMLSAFRKAYAKTKRPDPVLVYEEIENAVARLHAKKTNTGIKYTKHGENIHSALENLRAILSRQEYCVEDGVDFEEMIKDGLVFDLSRVSNTAKPYLYALILNQLYAIASTYDTDNDSRLRLLVCLEEAQLIYKDPDSAAVQDLQYRIQDFRKQGIGLMLLAHNISDIEQSIRRLCQVKLYLKQAPDVAPTAAKDLIFTYADEDQTISKLKHLDSRVGAFNYVIKEGTNKFSNDTVFIRTADYRPQPARCDSKAPKRPGKRLPRKIVSSIAISAEVSESSKSTDLLQNIASIQILYLGEEISHMPITEIWKRGAEGLIEGKTHTLQLLDRRGKTLAECKFAAKEHLVFRLKDGRLIL